MRYLSVVIPALNEAENLPTVMASIPRRDLAEAGWEVEVIVVDNASTDNTAEVARSLGARVVSQSLRGYGNAYQAGFNAAGGEVIATGDADCTYPFDALPHLLHIMDARNVEFMTTNRLGIENREAMKPSHTVANHALSTLSRVLFRNGLRDSQSGMWIFQRHVWQAIDVRSPGMAFSQEIKNAATRAGFRCLEVPIEYRVRGGQVKLNALPDGVANFRQLFQHKLRDNRLRTAPARMVPLAEVARANAAAERAADAAERAASAVEQLSFKVTPMSERGSALDEVGERRASASSRRASTLDEPDAGTPRQAERYVGEEFDTTAALSAEFGSSEVDELNAETALPSLPAPRTADGASLEMA